MSQLAAIAFSDIHFHRFKLFNKENSRLEWSLKAFRTIANIAQTQRVPLLFAGDLFHTPAAIDNLTLRAVVQTYKEVVEIPKVDFYAISGNHDMSEKNGTDHKSPSYLQTFYEVFGTFHLLDGFIQPWFASDARIAIQGIPYYNSEKELRHEIKNYSKVMKKVSDVFKILLLHGDCPGAIDHGMEMGETGLGKKEDLKKLFKAWDLVVMGHIHNPQKITTKILMCGSPIAQISSDTASMGYWKIFFDQPPKFYGLVGFPRFIKLGPEETAPENTIDYYIPFEEAEKMEDVEKGDFNLSNSRKTLAKRYLKKKGITDKKKKTALIKALNSVE